MDDTYIVTSFVMLDDLMQRMHYQSHHHAQVTDAEVITVAIVAARYFHNHHERALWVMQQLGYLSGQLSTSRFHRRLHALLEWLPLWFDMLASHWQAATLYLLDSFPLPVCQLVRSGRCQKVQGHIYVGYCASKQLYYFGWKVHLICTVDGLPVTFLLTPAAYHDSTPAYPLACLLPADATLYTDSAYDVQTLRKALLRDVGVTLCPLDHTASPEQRRLRQRFETFASQLEQMGIQHLHARTTQGISIKLYASLFALAFAHLTSN